MSRVLVLGGGGVVGTAWMLGLAAGAPWIADRSTDRIVGTSAGAIVGALLALGRDPDEVAARPRPRGGDRLANLTALLGTAAWPDRLAVVVTDAGTGERTVLDGSSGWELPRAVAASTAYPGTAEPVAHGGRTWIDGGMRSATNADLARGATRLVLVEPLAALVGPEPAGAEIAAVAPSELLHLVPGEDARAAFGSTVADLYDAGRWPAAFDAGHRHRTPRQEQFTEFHRPE